MHLSLRRRCWASSRQGELDRAADSESSAHESLDPVLPSLLQQRLAVDAEDGGSSGVIGARLAKDLADVARLQLLERPLSARGRGHELAFERRQRLGGDHVSLFDDDSALEDVAQLADVAGPVIAAQDGQRVLTYGPLAAGPG